MLQNYTELNIFEPHPFKHQLKFHKIRQFDISKSLGINEASLSRMLNGIAPMTEAVEDEIGTILESIKKPKTKAKAKPKKITKKGGKK